MKEALFEKQIIDHLQRLSIPEPDPEFEDRVYQKFMRQLQKKRKIHVFRRGLIWASSFAIIAIGAFLLWQSTLVQPLQQFTQTGKPPSSQTENVLPRYSSIPPDRYTLDGEGLYLTSNYITTGELGPWHFYDNTMGNKLYMGKEGEEPTLIHSVQDGYVTAHIYPNPSDPSEVLLIVLESRNNNIDYQYYYFVDASGNLTNIDFLPQYGYSDSSIHWSPNGEKALVLLKNAMYRNTALVLFDVQTFDYTLLFGNPEPFSEARRNENALGSNRLSLVTWISDELIVLLDNDRNTFYTLRTTDNWEQNYTTETFKIEGMNILGLKLYPLPKYESVLVKTGQIRLDVGFEPSYRLFTFNPNAGTFTLMNTVSVSGDAQYEQNFLMLSKDGDPVISTMVVQDDQYELIIQQMDPIRNIAMKQFNVYVPYVLSNPQVSPSPSSQRLAIDYNAEYYEENIDGGYRVYSLRFLVFPDLETQSIATYEMEEWGEMMWMDENRFVYGDLVIQLSGNAFFR